MDCSNSVKNNILAVIDEIEGELYSDGLIEYEVHVKHFKRNTKDKGILTIAEINQLFPADYDSLINIWRVRSTEREQDIYSFATAIYTILSTGMRSSEVRALQWNQFVRSDAILINAMIDSNDERVNRLKKWTDDNRALFALYYLGTASGNLPHFIDGEKYAYSNLTKVTPWLTPTFPPDDPRFNINDAKRALKEIGIKLPEDQTHVD